MGDKKFHDVVYSPTQFGEFRYVCRTCDEEVILYAFQDKTKAREEFKAEHPFDFAPQMQEDKGKKRKSWRRKR